jgi:hypothetical protein
MFDPSQDYDVSDMDIQPTADPRSVTKMQEMAKAELLANLAAQGMVPPQVAAKRILEAAEISDIDELAPEPDPAQAQMAQFAMQMQMEMGKADLTQKMVDIDLTIAKIESEKADAVKTMADVDAAQARLRLDGMTVLLKDRRDAIDTILKGGLAGMAGQPNNGGGQGRPAAYAGPSAGGGNIGLLGGPGMA